MRHLKQKYRTAQIIMTESEFLHYSDRLFAHIEDRLEDSAADFDCESRGNVLNIDAPDGSQIVINRHTPNQELWIAAKSGGYHFALQDGAWVAGRDGSEFFAVLGSVLSSAAGENVVIEALPVSA